MIAYLNGTLIDKKELAVVVDVNGVGYEVFCARSIVENMGPVGGTCRLFVHTQYRTDGASLFGFSSQQEKDLFLSLIKVDSVGPKSALNIMSAAPWREIAHLIEEGSVAQLAKLPKISKKTAEHLVVKLKGKLGDLFFEDGGIQTNNNGTQVRMLRSETQTALSHLGYKSIEIDRALNELDENIWSSDFQTVLRSALNHLSGNI